MNEPDFVKNKDLQPARYDYEYKRHGENDQTRLGAVHYRDANRCGRCSWLADSTADCPSVPRIERTVEVMCYTYWKVVD